MTKRTMTTSLLVLALSLSTMATALAYDFPSTNDANRDAGFPHVNLVETGIGFVTLEFVNDTNSLAFFEYRIDGEVLTSGDPHPIVIGDFIYDGVSVDSRNIADPVVEERTFNAGSTAEVHLALGGERDWDFDWVTFEVEPDASSKDDCKDGGWADFGFKNQGQCIRFVQTGNDSR
ncbi:MAG: PEP-CTERM sorting domain-containing protein [Acidimicrobiia bacterium]